MREQSTGKVRGKEINHTVRWLKSLPMKLAAIIAFLTYICTAASLAKRMILKIDLLRKDMLVIITLILWEALPRAGLIDPVFLPAASIIFMAIVNLLSSGELLMHISISLERALAGFALAVITMVPLGLAMGWYRTLEEITDRLVQACRQTSALSLFPMFILFFGIGELSKIVIIFWASLWPILLNTINGVKNVDTMMIKASISMGASDRILLTKVMLPAAAPSIFGSVLIFVTCLKH